MDDNKTETNQGRKSNWNKTEAKQRLNKRENEAYTKPEK